MVRTVEKWYEALHSSPRYRSDGRFSRALEGKG